MLYPTCSPRISYGNEDKSISRWLFRDDDDARVSVSARGYSRKWNYNTENINGLQVQFSMGYSSAKIIEKFTKPYAAEEVLHFAIWLLCIERNDHKVLLVNVNLLLLFQPILLREVSIIKHYHCSALVLHKSIISIRRRGSNRGGEEKTHRRWAGKRRTIVRSIDGRHCEVITIVRSMLIISNNRFEDDHSSQRVWRGVRAIEEREDEDWTVE